MLTQKGYSLIELIVFIVVLGIIGAGLSAAFTSALSGAPIIENEARAVELAEQRMDIILGQRWINGFSSTVDICTSSPSLPICTPSAGFTVSSSIANNWNGDTNYKVITVTVTGKGSTTLTSMVSDFTN